MNYLMTPMVLAEVSGEGMVHQLTYILIIGVCLLLLWWVGNWLCGVLGAPPIVAKGWMILFVVLGVLALINFLLGLTGHPLIKW